MTKNWVLGDLIFEKDHLMPQKFPFSVYYWYIFRTIVFIDRLTA